MEDRRIRWGVLSTAKIGMEAVIPAIRLSALGEVAAIASRDAARAEAAAHALGIPRAYGSYEALLADPEIDAIYNPLPNHLHVPWTIRAMRAGKHVLCEKPVALTASEAQSLVEARAQTGRLVAEAFMIRHTPWWHRVRELARSGHLGEVRAIQTFFSYVLEDAGNIRNMADIGGGGLMDIGCYAIASARYVLGCEPLRVAATLERDPRFGTDRLTSALLAFPGCHLTFTCSTQAAPCQRVLVVGSRRRVEVLIPFNAPAETACEIRIDDGTALDGSSAQVERFGPANQYALQADAFARAISGAGPLEFPIEDAVRNMQVIEAVFAAAASGQWQDLEPRA